MTDRPIIFSAPMMRALLEGRKTMTRRILRLPTKGEYVRSDMGGWEQTTVGGGGCFRVSKTGERIAVPEMAAFWNRTTGTTVVLPYQTGDRLWVRERWCRPDDGCFVYWADLCPSEQRDHDSVMRLSRSKKGSAYKPWRPSIHMPRQASRLTNVVTAVKVERLQEISREDAIAEGVIQRNRAERMDGYGLPEWPARECPFDPSEAFRKLWQSIHGPGSWDANPWVVAPTFTVHKINIDTMQEAA